MRCLPLLLALLALPAGAQNFVDDFANYPAGSDGAPAWQPLALGFATADGAYHGRDGLSVWHAVPFAAEASVAVDVAVTTPPGNPDGWLTAGLGLTVDERNYWGLHLVASPLKDGVRHHYCELSEALDGHWQAENADETKLTREPSRGGEFPWRDGVTYHCELSWSAAGIHARILEAGNEVAHFGFTFPTGTKVVAAGRPALRAYGFDARFSHAVASVAHVAAEPQAAPPPAWVSRPGEAIAPATGYFATKQVGDRWWLVDPEGKPFFDVGTDHIRYEGHWCEKLGYAPYSKVSAAKYGSEEAWAKVAAQRLRDWNFNVVAAGHAPSVRHRGLGHVLFASFGSGFAPRDPICDAIHWTGFPNVFSPDWPHWCRLVAARMAAEAGTDPWCLGYFLDNELEWYGKHGSLVDEVFQREPDHTAKKFLLDWLLARYGGLDGLNQALGTHFADKAAFLASKTVPIGGPKLPEIHSEFLKEIAERYFRVPCEALRAADPHHLIWGCRFAGQGPEEAVAICGKYTDVFTINTYPMVDMAAGVVQDTPALLARYYELAHKPMVITEWSFPALDAGLPCTSGAGMRVDTQAQKARCYQIFADMIADQPFMVGYHYFMYLDEPKEGIATTFPEDSNYGLINLQDEPYPELTAMATKVNAAVAGRHQRSSFAAQPPAAGPLPAGTPAALRNDSPNDLTDVPAVTDTPEPRAAILAKVAPGQTVVLPPDGDAGREVQTVELKGGDAVWACTTRGGGLFDAVSAEGLRLGNVALACRQTLPSGALAWPSAEHVERLTVRHQGSATILDAVMRHDGDEHTAAFRVMARAVVFVDRPLCLVRPLWYQSLDDRPWTLDQAFVFCRPQIGGGEDHSIVGGPHVPAYYLRFGGWTDEKLGGLFGAFCPRSDWNVSFFADTGKHPDAYFKVDVSLAKGQQWVAPQQSYLWMVALKDPSTWRAVTGRYQPAGELSLVPAEGH
jgi:hypothetical protein